MNFKKTPSGENTADLVASKNKIPATFGTNLYQKRNN